MSETAAAREMLEPFCQGFGIDMGFGGSAITPTALTLDLPQPYANSEKHKQILQGHCKNLSFFCDEVFDYVYSSHLLEDFTYPQIKIILKEWRRTLKTNGYLVTNCPDQQRFLKHCQTTGQSLNLAHKEPDFSLDTFKLVAYSVGDWNDIFWLDPAGPYSWYLVLQKK